jgi:hypothetical protein
MNFFDQMADRNMPQPAEAEVKVDLSGMEKGAALEKLDSIVTYCKRSSAKTLYISFDPAKPGAGETLFQPVARYLKNEKFHGYIQSALPLMTPDKGGLFVIFKL